MQVDPIMNGGNVVCESGFYFDENVESHLCFNGEMSILCDCVLGTNLEPQEMSVNDSYLTSLKKCFEGVDSKKLITLEGYLDTPLEYSQVVLLQDNIYETLGIYKFLLFLIPFDYIAFAIKVTFRGSTMT